MVVTPFAYFTPDILLHYVKEHLRINLPSTYSGPGSSLGTPTPEHLVFGLNYDGRPTNAQAGFQDFFISQRLTEYRAGDTNGTNDGLHEIFGFEVVVTRKISHIPASSVSDRILLNTGTLVPAISDETLYHVARAVQILLHNSNDLIGTINASGEGYVSSPFFVAPKWQYTSPQPEIHGPDWCIGLDSKEGNKKSFAVVRIRFGDMERIQCMATGDLH